MADGTTWSARAFGLDLELRIGAVPGLGPVPAAPGAARVVVREAAPGELDAAAPEQRLLDQRLPDGRLAAAFDRLADGRYLLDTPGFGRFGLAADGRDVACERPATSELAFQRMLVGHGLPLAAVLAGVEVLHASAVVLPGDAGALAVTAQSHGGKSSLAVQLARRGAGVLTDDALAVVPRDGDVVAQPGATAISVRRPEAERIEADGRGWPGTVLGPDGASTRVLLPAAPAAPLRWLCLLQRGADVPATSIEAVPPDPVALLTSTFNLLLRDGARLERLLDVCARIAASATVLRVRAPAHVGAAELAGELLEATGAA